MPRRLIGAVSAETVLAQIRKRLAIRSYRDRLGAYLNRKHGRHRAFTVPEVRAAARDLGLSSEYLIYAYARYCTKEAFDAHQRSVGRRERYEDVREEILRIPKHHAWSRRGDYSHVDFGGGFSTGPSYGSDWGDGGGDAGGGD
jgi:hypothetical protein